MTYAALIAAAATATATATDLLELVVSKVNVCDLAQFEGFADFDELPELAFALFTARTA